MLACASVMNLGCAQRPERAPDAKAAHFALDSASYVAASSGVGQLEGAEFRVIARFRNPTTDTLYLARCYPDSKHPVYGVVAVDSGGPESAYGPFWACVGHDRQFAVAPGVYRIDTLLISGPNAWDGRTKVARGVLEGRFRLYYEVQTCRGDGACRVLPERGLGLSTPFVVRRLPPPRR